MRKYVVFILMLTGAFACTKKQPRYYYTYLSDYEKAHYYFKPGSYWIYRDSISGRIDSFHVGRSVLRFDYINEWRREVINLYINQNSTDTNIKDYALWYLNINSNKPSNQIECRYLKNDRIYMLSNFSSSSPFAIYPRSTYKAGKGWIIVENNILNSYELKSNFFYNVLVAYDKDSFSEYASQTYTNINYFNDSVGFIKMSIDFKRNDTVIREVWELQRWHVVK